MDLAENTMSREYNHLAIISNQRIGDFDLCKSPIGLVQVQKLQTER